LIVRGFFGSELERMENFTLHEQLGSLPDGKLKG
jgi:hypothetical protein